jgi:hypothetical protein
MGAIRLAVFIPISLCLLANMAQVQADDLRQRKALPPPDQDSAVGPCLEFTQQQIDRIVSRPLRISPECRGQMKGRGCGKLGGPGYRSPRRKCVGYEELIKVCGERPHTATGCVCEGVKLAPGCQRPTAGAAPPVAHSARKKLKRVPELSRPEFEEPAQFEVPLAAGRR